MCLDVTPIVAKIPDPDKDKSSLGVAQQVGCFVAVIEWKNCQTFAGRSYQTPRNGGRANEIAISLGNELSNLVEFALH